jgi:hypothetical protein
MSVSGIGSYDSFTASTLLGGASGQPASGAAASSAASARSSGASNSALQDLVNYLKGSPAKRMEQAWLAQHNLTEQRLAAMPPVQQEALRKQMADDIKKKLQAQLGGSNGGVANIVV